MGPVPPENCRSRGAADVVHSTGRSIAGAGTRWALRFVLGLMVCYVASLVLRAAHLTLSLGRPHLAWVGRVVQSDPELGYAAVPGSVGARRLNPGGNIPVGFDQHGCRAACEQALPAEAAGAEPPLRLLGLGDSFAFADACWAEDSYLNQLARQMGAEPVNAALPGYGLAQMVERAGQLIPKLRPQVVVMQWSPWLAQRAAERYGPTQFGRLPVCCVGLNALGLPAIYGPPFRTYLDRVPQFRVDQSASLWSRMSWAVSCGLPVMLHDDGCLLLTQAAERLGLQPAPASPEVAAEFAIDRVTYLCREHGARLVVLKIGNVVQAAGTHYPIPRGVEATMVDGDRLLADCFGEDPQRLVDLAHWRGAPPEPVDPHPNSVAHAALAAGLAQALGVDASRTLAWARFDQPLKWDAELGWIYPPGLHMTTWYPPYSQSAEPLPVAVLVVSSGALDGPEHPQSPRLSKPGGASPAASVGAVEPAGQPFPTTADQVFTAALTVRGPVGTEIDLALVATDNPAHRLSATQRRVLERPTVRWVCRLVAHAPCPAAALALALGEPAQAGQIQVEARILPGDTADRESNAPSAAFEPGPSTIDYHLDRDGFRVAANVAPAAAELTVWLCLGDGSTLGLGVPQPETYAALIEHRWNDRTGTTGISPVRVLNHGQSGWNLRQQNAWLARHGARVRPRVVIVALTQSDQTDYRDDPAADRYDLRGVGHLQRLLPAEARRRWLESGRAADPTVWRNQLDELQETCRQLGAQLVLLPWSYEPWSPGFAAMIDQATAAASRNGAWLCDFENEAAHLPRGADLRAHPVDSHAGPLAHRLAAEALLKRLEGHGELATRPR